MEILELINFKTNRALKQFLKNNSVSFKKQFGQIVFDYNFYDTNFTVSACCNNTDVSYKLLMNDDKSNYHERIKKMLELKEHFTNALGQPKLDSSNHVENGFLSVLYETDSFLISIKCNSFEEYGSPSNTLIILCTKDFDKKLSENLKRNERLILWIPSLIGGFVFGLVMFLTMGSLKNYQSSYFWICMLGGLFFGVSFALLYGLWNRLENVQFKKGNKNYKKITNCFQFEATKKLFKGNLLSHSYANTSRHIKKPRIDVAFLSLNDKEIIVYSIVKKQKVLLKMPLKKAYYLILNDNLIFDNKTSFHRFFVDNDDYSSLSDTLFEKTIKREEFDLLFELLKKATINYNPFQLYNTNEQSYLDDCIAVVAKALLLKLNINHDELHQLVYHAFGDNVYYAISLTDLYLETYNVFIENFNHKRR